MGGPTNEADRLRCQLDDVIGLCMDARRQLMPIITRITQRARTIPEADDVVALIQVQGIIYQIEEVAHSKRPK